MVRGFTAGVPLFSSPRGFVNALKGRGMFGQVLSALEMQPVKFLSEAETIKAISTAPSAPNATSATGLRNQGGGAPGGGPCPP